MTNSRVEGYYRIANNLYAILEKNACDYNAALADIEALAKTEFMARLCGLLYVYDIRGDSKLPPFREDNSHLSFYTENINDAIQSLIDGDKITVEEWKQFKDTFHKILTLPYSPHIFYHLAWSNPGVDRDSPRATRKFTAAF